MNSWLREQRRVYFGNAASIKDYRIQLRSKKTLWNWVLYLGILVLLALANYQGAVVRGYSPAQIQNALIGYYGMVTGFLEGIILLVALSLGASSIVAEYELGAMELVSTSPASNKYFIVGKYMANLRQIALLLFLSLPITAVGVTLGGATGQQVIEHYLYIFMHAMVALAAAMLAAVIARSVFRATINAFACLTAFYGIVGMYLAASMSGFGGVPPLLGLVPFGEGLILGQTVTIFGHPISQALVSAVVTLAITKVLLLATSSAMSKAGSKDTVSLRIHVLILLAIYYGLLAWSIPGRSAMGFGGRTPAVQEVVWAWNLIFLPIFVVALAIGTWSRCEERKFFADRLFSFKEILGGRPSGTIGFTFVCVLLALVPAIWISSAASMPWLKLMIAPIFTLGCVAFLLGLGWFIGTTVNTIENGRRSLLGVVIGLSFLAAILEGLLNLVLQMVTNGNSPVVFINIFVPLGTASIILTKALVLWTIAIGLYVWGERRRHSSVFKLYRVPARAG